jgi:hypothetical protein
VSARIDITATAVTPSFHCKTALSTIRRRRPALRFASFRLRLAA